MTHNEHPLRDILYVSYLPDQDFLLPHSMREWLSFSIFPYQYAFVTPLSHSRKSACMVALIS